ncbi:MAG TPA: GNAT family N-acetyltransferase [Pyrinomonadaceae bacterium]|jgi:amino-acid N-acetyltransferase
MSEVEGVSISSASSGDLEEIRALLEATALPSEGVAEHLADFLVARDAEGALVGCIGLERHGRTGLLRSAAVAPRLQRSGLGSRLTTALLKRAARSGLEEMALLTTTAREFFSRRFGFEETERAAYDETFARSPEWHLPRCSTARFMRLKLNHFFIESMNR